MYRFTLPGSNRVIEATDEDVQFIAAAGNDFDFANGTILPSGVQVTDDEIKILWMIIWVHVELENQEED